jgi:hypothetical protein
MHAPLQLQYLRQSPSQQNSWRTKCESTVWDEAKYICYGSVNGVQTSFSDVDPHVMITKWLKHLQYLYSERKLKHYAWDYLVMKLALGTTCPATVKGP